MVSQFTQPQQLAPPQPASPSLSPAQWAQLAQLAQNQQQQSAYQPQVAPPSTSAYTSDGTMAAIDPALLQAQWLQYQQSQLSKSAIIPQSVHAQYAPQYALHQPQGEFIGNESISALAQFIESANYAATASAQYIDLLESILAEHRKLIDFSAKQDDLIWRFLHDREFTLDYIRGAWIRESITDDFMSRLAEVYLEIAALSPRGNDTRYTGNPNIQFDAQVITRNPSTQPNLIPPLPSSNGNGNRAITMEQYLIAQQQGLAGAARAAAMANPVNLYASLFQ